jgi:hypothetical protein
MNDTLLTLDQARAALIGDAAAERSNAWPSIRTLRRAYSAGQLAVVQPVAGGRVMVWQSELLRWATAPRTAPTHPREARTPEPGAAPRRRSGRRQPSAPKPARTATASRARERTDAPPRLSLADVNAT